MKKIIAGLMLSLICVSAQAVEFKSKESLTDIAKAWNKDLPIMLDDLTEFTNVEAKEAKLVFFHRVHAILKKGSPSPDELKKQLMPKVVETVCSMPQLKIFIDKGVSLEYVYHAMDKKLIVDFTIETGACDAVH